MAPELPSGPDAADLVAGGGDDLSASRGDDLFASGGEAGRLMAAHDWAHTAVGPVEGWPQGLRFAVRTVLASRFPMVLTWGPDFLQFYNDAYAPFIGAKHPAIGEDIRVTLAEGWDALAGPVEHAMSTREASWLPRLPLLLERAGYREETYFTVSHAPAFGDDGTVAGMHAVCTEVTGEVLGERRQELLHALSTADGALGDEAAVLDGLCAALAGDPLDVPFAAVYLDEDGGSRLRRAATIGCAPERLPASVADAVELPGGVAELRIVGGLWEDRVRDAVALPLTGSSGERVGVLVLGVSPNLELDDEYRTFLQLVAGQFVGALGNARAFEAERRRAESLAELDRAKTAFFSDVSHELRTPLTLLLGPIDDVLAGADGLPAAARDQLTLAARNGRRLQRLVNDLMDVASIEAGRATAVRVATDLPAFTAELAGVLRAAAERAGLSLTVDCPPLPHPAAVDPRMWEKVVLNLLSNAVKYTFVGGIGVRLRGTDDAVELTVTDTGIGIAAEELPLVFDRFHRVAGSLARNREGTGIGLALVRELVTLHGGVVHVDSEPGRGSTFTVTVPYGTPDAEGDAGATGPSEAARGTAEAWETDVAPREQPADPVDPSVTVLVVDDNADMRTYLTRLLAPIWQVRTCADGEEALAVITEHRPDVVVTDVMMPRVDGFELLQRLRADPATRGVPVLMLTARAGQEAAVEGFAAGVDDYLAKPFQAAELIARLRVAIERAAGVRTVDTTPTGTSPTGGPSTGAAPTSTAPMSTVPAGTTPAGTEPTGTEPTGTGPAPAGPPSPAGPGGRADVRTLVPASRRPAAPAAPPPPPAPPAPPVHFDAWRFPASPRAVPALRRALRRLLESAGVDEDQAYDLLLAACEAATNAVEHAQDPIEPFIDVTVEASASGVVITVRDFGQWRERGASMDRGRGSTLMSAFADVSAVPSPEGTTVTIRAQRAG
ncbi:ATP-binding protein [Modestobacter sp. VKM Ac-2986]|uniref:ATP-binding protein n=1 Tax=Modestobacter sp. VKM Ac-2986 TaxID=3004140 RepID=UPI0022AA2570|nr:ATP-binding protein [Modestobacter sp. VKM Ac-2986]MCZ2827659.1 ATP-binding protein [Modestobacter sp. VKM Ac-2986]